MSKIVPLVGLVAVLVGCSEGSGDGIMDPMGPGSGPALAYAGSFHPVVHAGSGMAQIYVSSVGSELRLSSDFATDAGPALEVWLISADDANDSAAVLAADYVSLGVLQSPNGPQTYPIPAGTDLSMYRAVTVWCVAAKVNFTTAPLSMP